MLIHHRNINFTKYKIFNNDSEVKDCVWADTDTGHYAMYERDKKKLLMEYRETWYFKDGYKTNMQPKIIVKKGSVSIKQMYIKNRKEIVWN